MKLFICNQKALLEHLPRAIKGLRSSEAYNFEALENVEPFQVLNSHLYLCWTPPLEILEELRIVEHPGKTYFTGQISDFHPEN